MSDRNSLDLSDDDEDVEVGAISSNQNIQPQEKSGILSKWTNYIHGWQDRYTVVKDVSWHITRVNMTQGTGAEAQLAYRKPSSSLMNLMNADLTSVSMTVFGI